LLQANIRKFSVTVIFLGFALFGAATLCFPDLPQATNASNDDSIVLQHLGVVVNWYKNLITKVPPAPEPADQIYLNNAQHFGAQAVRLAFESAKAQAALELQPSGNETGTTDQNGSVSGAIQRYAKLESDISQRIADDQNQLDALKTGSSKMKRADREAKQQSLQGKLELDKASLNAIRQLRAFAERGSAGEAGLKGKINQLATSVPEILETQSDNKLAVPATAGKTAAAPRSGLIGELVTLYEELQTIHSIDQRINEADSIRAIVNNLRTPLRNQLTSTFQSERDLAADSGVTKEQYDALTTRFKEISAVLVPLSEELVVLDQSNANLDQWKKSHGIVARDILIATLSRVAIIAIAIAIVLGLGEAWRRLTFRYIHDARLRRQFMVLRKFVTGFLVFVVLVMGFASEFSSLATFAGFVTAGIAVGLQTILLSVAAYFFVIGRYGISVGDRVSVAGVTGDVVDVGLVRFYVMELASTGPDLFPTGRIVVFSNAVLFQATTPLFKQLPGTRYTWHEAVLPLAARTDYDGAEKAVGAVVTEVYKEYNLESLWRARRFDASDFSIQPPVPHNRIQFADSGPELVARYPVQLEKAGEIDDKMARALISALNSDPQLAAATSGPPKIRATIKN